MDVPRRWFLPFQSYRKSEPVVSFWYFWLTGHCLICLGEQMGYRAMKPSGENKTMVLERFTV